MIIYRISHPLFSKDLMGTGAKLHGGRWNSEGVPMLYTAEHISLSILEMLVHSNFSDYEIALHLVYIQAPDASAVQSIQLNKLKKSWPTDLSYTRFIGDEFIRSKQALLLKVPSVIVPEEHNFIINPTHPDFKKITLLQTQSFKPDKRLLHI